MKRIEKEWTSFWGAIAPNGAPDVQRTETRRAFYAGAYMLLNLLLAHLSKEGDDATPADLSLMDDVHAELEAFFREVKAGRK